MHLKSIFKSLTRIVIKRIRRTASVVNSEYNDGHWNNILSEKRWLTCKTLEEYVYSFNPRQIKCIIDGKHVQILNNEYYRRRNRELANIIRPHLGKTDTIVEIGSGTGYNVFALSCIFPDLKFVGLDISEKGIQASREITEHFKITDRFDFAILNLTDLSHPGFKKLQNAFILSYFCLEQLPNSISKVISNIIAADVKMAVHIEPDIVHLHLTNPLDWANYVYIKSVNYQTDLHECLAQLHESKKLKILSEKSFRFAPTVQNRGLVSIWERL